MVTAIPRVLGNSAVVTFVVYLCVIRLIPGLLTEGLMLKFIQNGVPKTTIITIETILLPYNLFMIFFVGWCIKRFKIQRLMLSSFVMKNANLVFILIKFLVLLAYIKALKQRGFDVDIDSNTLCNTIKLTLSHSEELRRGSRRHRKEAVVPSLISVHPVRVCLPQHDLLVRETQRGGR